MKRSRSVISLLSFAFVFLLSSVPAFSQKKKSKGASSKYNWGVGVKIGDPMGVSVKKYNGDRALEFILGGSNVWGDYRYNRFDKHKGYYNSYYYGYTYKGRYIDYYDYSRPVAFQVHYLFHKPFPSVDGLTWYFGFGGQFRYSSIRYNYWDGNGRYYTDGRISNIGIGADGVIGMEYTFKEIPLSLGLDMNLYMELADEPFLFLPQGGLAVRYNF